MERIFGRPIVTQGGTLVGMISVRDIVVFLTNLPRK